LHERRLRREAAALGSAFLLSVTAFIIRRLLGAQPAAPVDLVDLASIVIFYAASTLFIEHPEIVPSPLRRTEIVFDAAILSVVYAGIATTVASGEGAAARALGVLAALACFKLIYDLVPFLRKLVARE
jgi:hypothetical protein